MRACFPAIRVSSFFSIMFLRGKFVSLDYLVWMDKIVEKGFKRMCPHGGKSPRHSDRHSERDPVFYNCSDPCSCCGTWQIGSKGLEIKVDNPESYNFRPKEMLREICATMSQFANEPSFHKVHALA